MEIYLGGERRLRNPHVVRYEEINTDYFQFMPRVTQPRLLKEERARSFEEIDLKISANLAMKEAERCFNCGICNQCDNCFIFCPDSSVIREQGSSGTAYQLRLLQGMRPVRRGMPAQCHVPRGGDVMKRVLEGSHAVAEAVRLAKVQVISAYPITPQTHIVEILSEYCAKGLMNARFLRVESEHSCLAALIGAQSAGCEPSRPLPGRGWP